MITFSTHLRCFCIRVGLSAALLFLFVLSAAPAAAQSVSQKETPPPVLNAFKKSWPNATIRRIARDTTKEGAWYFKIESQDGKTLRNVYYSPAGEEAQMEESIDPATLPKRAKDLLAKKYPHGFIVGGVRYRSPFDSGIQIDVQTDNKKISLVFDTTGRLRKK